MTDAGWFMCLSIYSPVVLLIEIEYRSLLQNLLFGYDKCLVLLTLSFALIS